MGTRDEDVMEALRRKEDSQLEEIRNRLNGEYSQTVEKAYQDFVTKEINEMTLINDGRKEVGYISNLKIEVEE